MNTTHLKELAQLAQAAYGYFDETTFAGRGGNDDALRQKIREAGKGDFAQLEANTFTDRYRLLHQFRDASVNIGFSASLFQDKQSGQLVFAIRGTEFALSGGALLTDLLIADLRIGIDGYASPQVIPLYRYFKQLNTGAGAAVSYTAAELARLEAVYFDQFPDTEVRRAEWNNLEAGMLADTGVDAGQGTGNALIAANQAVNVAGHSLGGHLALLMDRLFPAKVRGGAGNLNTAMSGNSAL